MAVLWGRFEMHFDDDLLMCINIARRFGIEREMQVSLTRKTRLFRQLFDEVPVFTPLAPTLGQIMDDVEESSKGRNLILHSLVESLGHGDPPTLNLVNQRHKGKMLIISKVKVSLAQISQHITAIDGLNTRMIALTWNLSRYQEGGGIVETGQPPTR